MGLLSNPFRTGQFVKKITFQKGLTKDILFVIIDLSKEREKNKMKLFGTILPHAEKGEVRIGRWICKVLFRIGKWHLLWRKSK